MAVAAKIKADDKVVCRQCWGDMGEPVAIGKSTMQEDECWLRSFTPGEAGYTGVVDGKTMFIGLVCYRLCEPRWDGWLYHLRPIY